MLLAGDPTINSSLGAITNTLCEGELLQLHHRDDLDIDEETYFEIVRRKTASLIGECCRLGALLSGTGTPSLSGDTVVLHADQVTDQPGLFFQGDSSLNGGSGITFGDGIRCCGTNVIRLEIVPGAGGSAETTSAISQHPQQMLSAGDTKCYQFWYRDPVGGPCGSTFNLSNALEVTWLP